jgi:hypothetical protein
LRRCKQELEREQTEAQEAHEHNLAWRAEWEAEHGRKLTGRKPTPPAKDALQKRKINTTDPDTRVMKRAGGRSVQGYNAQVVSTPGQVIIAADITQQSNDSGQLLPMIKQASESLREVAVERPIGTVLADGGYWNSSQIESIHRRGIEVIVPTKNDRRTAARTLSARRGPQADRIERVLATPAGQALYRRRQQIVEPVFANTKFIRRIDRFQRRGLPACRAEWRLIAATHNLLKLWRAGLAPQPA